MCAEITLYGHHLRPSPFPSSLLNLFFSQSGKPVQDTQENGHMSGKPGRTHMTMDTWNMFFFFFFKTQRGPAALRTSAARGASSCTTATASCRRPGTRTGCRSGRHPTPGAPACRDERPKSCVWEKGRLNVRSTAQKKMRELLITGIYPARELFCITVLN